MDAQNDAAAAADSVRGNMRNAAVAASNTAACDEDLLLESFMFV